MKILLLSVLALALSGCHSSLEGRAIGCRGGNLVWSRASVEGGQLLVWKEDLSPFASNWKPVSYGAPHVARKAGAPAGSELIEVSGSRAVEGGHERLALLLTWVPKTGELTNVHFVEDGEDVDGDLSSHWKVEGDCPASDLWVEQPLHSRADSDAGVFRAGSGGQLYFYASYSNLGGEDEGLETYIQDGSVGQWLEHPERPYCKLSLQATGPAAGIEPRNEVLLFGDVFTVTGRELETSLYSSFESAPSTRLTLTIHGEGSASVFSSGTLVCDFPGDRPLTLDDLNRVLGPSMRMGAHDRPVPAHARFNSEFTRWMETPKPTLGFSRDILFAPGKLTHFQRGKVVPSGSLDLKKPVCSVGAKDGAAGAELAIRAGERFAASDLVEDIRPDLSMPGPAVDPMNLTVQYSATLTSGDREYYLLCDSGDPLRDLSLAEMSALTGGLLEFESPPVSKL
jgi:hypothetical protein